MVAVSGNTGLVLGTGLRVSGTVSQEYGWECGVMYSLPGGGCVLQEPGSGRVLQEPSGCLFQEPRGGLSFQEPGGGCLFKEPGSRPPFQAPGRGCFSFRKQLVDCFFRVFY